MGLVLEIVECERADRHDPRTTVGAFCKTQLQVLQHPKGLLITATCNPGKLFECLCMVWRVCAYRIKIV